MENIVKRTRKAKRRHRRKKRLLARKKQKLFFSVPTLMSSVVGAEVVKNLWRGLQERKKEDAEEENEDELDPEFQQSLEGSDLHNDKPCSLKKLCPMCGQELSVDLDDEDVDEEKKEVLP